MPWPWSRRKILQKQEETVWRNDKRVPLSSLSEPERARVIAARLTNGKLQQIAEERRKENDKKKKNSPKF